MKIRSGFVSNSSTSSFICEICGRTEAGMDLCISEADMSRCERQHLFCNCHQPDLSDELEDDYDLCYNIPEEKCPICQFEELSSSDAIRFLMKKAGLTSSDVLNDIKRRFDSYEEFENYLKGNQTRTGTTILNPEVD